MRALYSALRVLLEVLTVESIILQKNSVLYRAGSADGLAFLEAGRNRTYASSFG